MKQIAYRSDASLEPTPHFLLFSKHYPNTQSLLTRFNEGLKALKESGEHDRMIKASRSGQYIIEH